MSEYGVYKGSDDPYYGKQGVPTTSSSHNVHVHMSAVKFIDRNKGESKMSKKFEKAREFVAEFIHTKLATSTDQELEGTDFTILKAFPPEFNVGPYGGHQQVILGAIDNGSEVYPFLIAIYSDDKCQDKLMEYVESVSERQNLRDMLRNI